MVNEFVMTVGPHPQSGPTKQGLGLGWIFHGTVNAGHCFFSNCTYWFDRHLVPVLISAAILAGAYRCLKLNLQCGPFPPPIDFSDEARLRADTARDSRRG